MVCGDPSLITLDSMYIDLRSKWTFFNSFYHRKTGWSYILTIVLGQKWMFLVTIIGYPNWQYWALGVLCELSLWVVQLHIDVQYNPLSRLWNHQWYYLHPKLVPSYSGIFLVSCCVGFYIIEKEDLGRFFKVSVKTFLYRQFLPPNFISFVNIYM